jgi:VanZ family protein
MGRWFYNKKVHFVLYALLLVFTPFIMLQNYLQEAIGMLSRAAFNVGKLHVPFTVLILIVVVGAIIFLSRKLISKPRILALCFVILLVFLGQKTSDYYFNHKFYDLQHNWHYIAYGIYAWMFYRLFQEKTTSKANLILKIYLSALALSIFDETFQKFISLRVFDIGDIAKDSWGVFIGLIFVFFVIEDAEIFSQRKSFFKPHIKEYLKSPFSLLVFIGLFAYVFLFISSLLTDIIYLKQALLITLGVFVVLFIFIHLLQYKRIRYLIIASISILCLVSIYSFFKPRENYIVYKTKHLVIYRGIPIPYFDVLIHPDGRFRLVDKKTYFNNRDMLFLYYHANNILLVGCGENESFVEGFPENQVSQFVFNPESYRAIQIIMLPNAMACEQYNRIKKEDKELMFIIHQE